MQINNFIKENSYWIYEYINTVILKDIGVMSPDYFVKIIQEIFKDESNIENHHNLNTRTLPYFILTQLATNGRVDYTSLRAETIDFTQINKEASVYYNYARFSLKEECLLIELMQSKMGGMAVDNDIVKFSKSIPIHSSGLEQFIKEKGTDSSTSKDTYKKIKELINTIGE